MKPRDRARRRSHARHEPPHTAAPPTPLASGAARALVAALAATLLVRVAAMFAPGRYLWGADLGRDLPPLAFWLPWAACALALVPAVSRRFTALLPRQAHGALVPALAVGLVVVAGVLAFPERAFLTGDSALRHGEFAETADAARLVPQALPADLWLHHTLPRAIAQRTALSAEQVGRAWDALLAALLVWAAWGLARAAARSGAGAFAALGVATFTGALALFNGYAKSIVEVNVLMMFALASLLSIARDGRGTLRLGLATAGALLLHRSALALLPAWALGLWLARPRDPGAWRRPATWLPAALPLAALAATGPRVFRTLATFDATHHLGTAQRSWQAWLAASFAPTHLLEVSQVVLLIAPLAIPLAALLVTRRAAWRRRELLLLMAFALPQLGLVLLVHPQQGAFRDWDVFATGAIAWAGLAAWLVAETLDAERDAAWLALPVVLCALVPSLQWLAHQSDMPRALARASSILEGPPERPVAERASGYDHIGLTCFQRGRHALALEAFQRSIEAAPNPRLFVEAGMAETMLGRPREALAYYLEAVRRDPNQTMGWQGVAAASSALDDVAHMEEAERALSRLDPNGPTTHDARAYLASRREREP